ncbi:hypothetical protein D3C77_359000 [compost metagenome]
MDGGRLDCSKCVCANVYRKHRAKGHVCPVDIWNDYGRGRRRDPFLRLVGGTGKQRVSLDGERRGRNGRRHRAVDDDGRRWIFRAAAEPVLPNGLYGLVTSAPV